MNPDDAITAGYDALGQAVSMASLDWNTHFDQAVMPRLQQGEIHLWALNLSGDNAARVAPWLVESDTTRGSRIRDPEKRQLYLGGRAGLRLLLSGYTGIANRDLKFGYGERGKPVLLNQLPGSTIFFNYTLSANKVLYAISSDRELGVDMESLPRKINPALLAARKLSLAERTAWQGLAQTVANDAMLCCWTRKEAYGKAIGVGIRYNLAEVSMFEELEQPCFETHLSGLFAGTDSEGFADHYRGVQIRMPFPAVASLMYPVLPKNPVDPGLKAWQLVGHESPDVNIVSNL